MKNRSATDIVVILLACMVGASLVIIIIGAVTTKLVRPEVDLTGAGKVIADILKTIVVALISFVGGRAAGRIEANGVPNAN